MKRLALFTTFMTLALAASAQQADTSATRIDPAPALATATEQQRVAADQKAQNDLSDRNCLKSTGSRLITADRNGRKCANAPGRAYTRDDLDRAGTTDLADALRRLDPAIR